jgi:(p)ppGpp synthase/HD superfamily hydrolase
MPGVTEQPLLGERFDRALLFASTLDARDTRKKSDIPYISHLLAVAAIVLEHGGDEAAAVGALLHDAVEDHGDVVTPKDVAQIVKDCSDNLSPQEKAQPWEIKKNDT